MSDTDNPGLLAYYEAAREYRADGGMAQILTADAWTANREYAQHYCPSSDWVDDCDSRYAGLPYIGSDGSVHLTT